MPEQYMYKCGSSACQNQEREFISKDQGVMCAARARYRHECKTCGNG